MKPLLKAFFENKYAINLALILIPVFTYIRAYYYDFSPLDDVWLIIKNENSLKDWGNCIRSFEQTISEVYYRPLLFDTFIINYQMNGLDASIYHLTNIIFHAIAALILYRFLKQYEVKKQLAFALTILFVIHPVMLHSVVWVPGRNDIMLALFCLLSLYFQNRNLFNKRLSDLLFQLLFFIMALLTKETAIVMPLVFIANSYIRDSNRKRMLANFTFSFVIALAWFLYRKSIVKEVAFIDGELLLKLKNTLYSFLIFTGKTIVPVQHSLYPTIENSSILPGIITLAILIGAAIYFKFTNKRYAYFGIFMYLIFLIIPLWFVSGSVTREQYENRLYTPLIGIVFFIAHLNINWKKMSSQVVMGGITLVFFGMTFKRMGDYKDYHRYIEYCIEDNPNNYFFHQSLADDLMRSKDFEGAIKHYGEAIRIQPSRAIFYNNRANAYVSLGNKQEALRDFDSAIVKSGGDPVVYLNRCYALSELNEFDASMSELRRLKECCQEIIPMHVEKEIRSRWTMNGFNKIEELLKKQPNNALLYANRAKLNYDVGRINEAMVDKQKALSLAPKNEQLIKYLEEIK